MTEKSNKETEKSFEEKAKNLFTDVKEEQTDKTTNNFKQRVN